MAKRGDDYDAFGETSGNGASPNETDHQKDPILSDKDRRVLEIIFYCSIGGLIGVAGSAANVINIIIFIKQGLNDSVSISLCALAVSDLGYLLLMVSVSICSNPLLQYSDTVIDTAEINYIAGGVFESCFLKTTHLITAFITFERCVCVAMPLKVKNIITLRRTLISIVSFYVIIFAVSTPVFSYVHVALSFNAKRNRTIIGIVFTSTTFDQGLNSFNILLQFSAFLVIIICTVILVLKLLSKLKWRHIATTKPNVSDSLSTRDKRVTKMVTFISIIFIACYFLNMINVILGICLSPEYSAAGSYANSYFVSWAIICTPNGFSSSVSIIVYYNMSSKFRATFKGLFITQYHPNKGE